MTDPRTPSQPDTDPSTLSKCIDWTFRSRVTGKLTVGQFPNVSLWIFLASVAAGFALEKFSADASGLRAAVGVIGTLALLWWSVDEVVRGVNPWRRVLGLVVFAFVGMGVLRDLTA